MFFAMTSQAWSAVAAICSAVAAFGLGVIGVMTWKATKRMSDATVEYVKATREIVAITHNPVVGIEIKQLEVRERDNRVVVNYNWS